MQTVLKRAATLVALVVIVAALLTGCPSAPTRQDIQSYNFGDRPSEEASTKAIVAHMSSKLRDPGSATYQCGFPRKGSAWSCEHQHHGAGDDCGTQFGYIAVCVINAKNGYGGYVGPQKYFFMLRGTGSSLIAYDLDIHPKWIHIYE